MELIKNLKNGKYYKTKNSISNDRVRMLYSSPFIKAGVLTDSDIKENMLCLDKWPFIEIVTHFDGRRNTWMRGCEWFSWLVVTE